MRLRSPFLLRLLFGLNTQIPLITLWEQWDLGIFTSET